MEIIVKVTQPNIKVPNRDFTVTKQISLTTLYRETNEEGVEDNKERTINYQEILKDNGETVKRFIRSHKKSFIPDPCEMTNQELAIITKLIDIF